MEGSSTVAMALQPAQVLDNDCSRREDLFARLADDPHLPSPPAIVLQVLEEASRLDCTPAELAAVIHRDAALCGKILRTVNIVRMILKPLHSSNRC